MADSRPTITIDLEVNGAKATQSINAFRDDAVEKLESISKVQESMDPVLSTLELNKSLIGSGDAFNSFADSMVAASGAVSQMKKTLSSFVSSINVGKLSDGMTHMFESVYRTMMSSVQTLNNEISKGLEKGPTDAKAYANAEKNIKMATVTGSSASADMLRLLKIANNAQRETGLTTSQIDTLIPALYSITKSKVDEYRRTTRSTPRLEELASYVANQDVFKKTVTDSVAGYTPTQHQLVQLAKGAVVSTRRNAYRDNLPILQAAGIKGSEYEFVTDQLPDIFKNSYIYYGRSGAKQKGFTLNADDGRAEASKEVYRNFRRLVQNGNQQAIRLGQDVGLLRASNGYYQFSGSANMAQLNTMAGLLAQVVGDAKSSLPYYYTHRNDQTSEGQRKLLGRQNNVFNDALDLMEVLSGESRLTPDAYGYVGFGTNPRASLKSDQSGLFQFRGYIDNPKNDKQIARINRNFSDYNKKAVRIQTFGTTSQYVVPKTHLENGELVWRDPAWQKENGVQEKKEDHFATVGNSALTWLLGMYGNNTYGNGRDEDGRAYYQDPKILRISTSQLYKQVTDKDGTRMIVDPARQAEADKINRLFARQETIRYGRPDTKEKDKPEYIAAFGDAESLTMIKKDDYDAIVKKFAQYGMANPFDNMNVGGLFESGNYKNASKMIDVGKKKATPGFQYSMLGYNQNPTAALIDFEKLYDYLGVPDKDQLMRTSQRLDGLALFDPTVLGVNAQMRAGLVSKFMGQTTDWRRLLYGSGLLEKAYQSNNNRGLIAINKDNALPGYGRGYSFYMPQIGIGKDEEFILDDGTTVKGVNGLIDKMNSLAGFNSDTPEGKLLEDIRKKYFFDIMSQEYTALLPESTVKNNDKFRIISKDAFNKGGLFENEVGKWAKDLGNGTVALTADQQRRYFEKAIELSGGYWINKTGFDFRTDKDFIPESLAAAMGADSSVLKEQSNANYEEYIHKMQTDDNARIRFLKQTSYGRRLVEDGLYNSDLANRLVQSHINDYEAKREQGHLFLPEYGIDNLLTGVLPGSIFGNIFEAAFNVRPSDTNKYRKLFSYQDEADKVFMQTLTGDQSQIVRRNAQAAKLMLSRMPAAPGEYGIGVQNIGDQKAIQLALDRLGVDYSNTVFTDPSLQFKLMTGDYDGDTAWVIRGLNDDQFERMEAIQKYVQNARLKLKEQIAGAPATEKKKLENDLQAYTNFGADHFSAQLGMGLSTAAIRNSLADLNDNDPDKWIAIAEAIDAYDKNTSERMKEGLDVPLGAHAQRAAMEGALFKRFVKQINSFGEGSEHANPNLFSTRLPEIKDTATLFGIVSNFKAKRRGENVGGKFGNDLDEWLFQQYGYSNSYEAQAARTYGQMFKNIESGSRLVNRDDIANARLIAVKWGNSLERDRRAGRNQESLDEEQKKLNAFVRRLDQQESSGSLYEDYLTNIQDLEKQRDQLIQSGTSPDDRYIQGLNKKIDLYKTLTEDMSRPLQIAQQNWDKELADMNEDVKKRYEQNVALAKNNGINMEGGIQAMLGPALSTDLVKAGKINFSDVSPWLYEQLNKQNFHINGVQGYEFDSSGQLVKNKHEAIQASFFPYPHNAAGILNQKGEILAREMDVKNEWLPYTTNIDAVMGTLRHNAFQVAMEQYAKGQKIDAAKIYEGLLTSADLSSSSDFKKLGLSLEKNEKTGEYTIAGANQHITDGVRAALGTWNEKTKQYEGGSIANLVNSIINNGYRVANIEGFNVNSKGEKMNAKEDDPDDYTGRGSRFSMKVRDSEGKEVEKVGTFAPDLILQDKAGKYSMIDYKSSPQGALDSLFQMMVYAKDIQNKVKNFNANGRMSDAKSLGWDQYVDAQGNLKFKSFFGFDTSSGKGYRYEFNDAVASKVYDEYQTAIANKLFNNEEEKIAAEKRLVAEASKRYGITPTQYDKKTTEEAVRTLTKNNEQGEWYSNYLADKFIKDEEVLNEIMKTGYTAQRRYGNRETGGYSPYAAARRQLEDTVDPDTIDGLIKKAEEAQDSASIAALLQYQQKIRQARNTLNSGELLAAQNAFTDIESYMAQQFFGVKESAPLNAFNAVRKKMLDAASIREGLKGNKEAYDSNTNTWLLKEYQDAYDQSFKDEEIVRETFQQYLPQLKDRAIKQNNKQLQSLLSENKESTVEENVESFYQERYDAIEQYVKQQEHNLNEYGKKLREKDAQGQLVLKEGSEERQVFEELRDNAEKIFLEAYNALGKPEQIQEAAQREYERKIGLSSGDKIKSRADLQKEYLDIIQKEYEEIQDENLIPLQMELANASLSGDTNKYNDIRKRLDYLYKDSTRRKNKMSEYAQLNDEYKAERELENLRSELKQNEIDSLYNGRGLSRDNLVNAEFLRRKIQAQEYAKTLDKDARADFWKTHQDPILRRQVENELAVQDRNRQFQHDQRLDNIQFQNAMSDRQRQREYDRYNRQRYGHQSRLFSYYQQGRDRYFDLESTALSNEQHAKQTRQQIANLRASLGKSGNTEADIANINNSISEAEASLQGYTQAAASARAEMENFGNGSNLMAAGLKRIDETLTSVVPRLGRQVFQKALQEARQFVQQFDSSINEIQAITMKSGGDMQGIRSQTIDKAINLRTSVSNVAGVEAALYRQGLSDSEVSERTDSIIKFATVTKLNVTEATKIITTALQNDLVPSAEAAMDTLVALGDSAATTAAEIGKGMQKAAASAKVAGVSYQELTALLTIGTSDTQLSGTQVGTALQTVFSRMRKLNLNDYVSDQNGKTTTSNDAEAALASVGIELWDDKAQGKMKSSFEILRSLSKVWQDLNDAQKSVVTNAMAGTRQTNIFSTLMEGMGEDGGANLEKYLDLASNSGGITQSKYEIAMQSLAASMDELRSSWDKVVESFVNSGAITGVLDTVSNILQGIANVADNGGQLGIGLSAIAGGLAAIFASIKLFQSASLPGFLVNLLSIGAGLLVGGVGLGLTSALTPETDSQRLHREASEQRSTINDVYSNNQTRIAQKQEAITTAENKYNTLQEIKNTKSDEYARAFNDYKSAMLDVAYAFPNLSSSIIDATENLGNFSTAIKQANDEAEEEKKQNVRQYNEEHERYYGSYGKDLYTEEVSKLLTDEDMKAVRRTVNNFSGRTDDLDADIDFAYVQGIHRILEGGNINTWADSNASKAEMLYQLYQNSDTRGVVDQILGFDERAISLISNPNYNAYAGASESDNYYLAGAFDSFFKNYFENADIVKEGYGIGLRKLNEDAVKEYISGYNFGEFDTEGYDIKTLVTNAILDELYDETGNLSEAFGTDGIIDWDRFVKAFRERINSQEKIDAIVGAASQEDLEKAKAPVITAEGALSAVLQTKRTGSDLRGNLRQMYGYSLNAKSIQDLEDRYNQVDSEGKGQQQVFADTLAGYDSLLSVYSLVKNGKLDFSKFKESLDKTSKGIDISEDLATWVGESIQMDKTLALKLRTDEVFAPAYKAFQALYGDIADDIIDAAITGVSPEGLNKRKTQIDIAKQIKDRSQFKEGYDTFSGYVTTLLTGTDNERASLYSSMEGEAASLASYLAAVDRYRKGQAEQADYTAIAQRSRYNEIALRNNVNNRNVINDVVSESHLATRDNVRILESTLDELNAISPIAAQSFKNRLSDIGYAVNENGRISFNRQEDVLTGEAALNQYADRIAEESMTRLYATLIDSLPNEVTASSIEEVLGSKDAGKLLANDTRLAGMILEGAGRDAINGYINRQAQGNAGTFEDNYGWVMSKLIGNNWSDFSTWQTSEAASRYQEAAGTIFGSFIDEMLASMPQGDAIKAYLSGQSSTLPQDYAKSFAEWLASEAFTGQIDSAIKAANVGLLTSDKFSDNAQVYGSYFGQMAAIRQAQYGMTTYTEEGRGYVSSLLGLDQSLVKELMGSETGSDLLQNMIHEKSTDLIKQISSVIETTFDGVDLGTVSDFDSLINEIRAAAETAEGDVKDKLTTFADALEAASGAMSSIDENDFEGAFNAAIESSKGSRNTERGLYSLMNDVNQLNIHDENGNVIGQESYYEALVRTAQANKRSVNWQSFMKENAGVVSALNMLEFGRMSGDAFNAYLANSFYGGQKSPKYYGATAGMLFNQNGQQFFNNNGTINTENLNADFLEQFERLKLDENGGADFLDEYISKYSEFADIISSLASGDFTKAKRQAEEFNKALVDEGIEFDAVGEYANEYATSLKNLAKGGKTATQELAKLRSKALDSQDLITATQKAKGKKGKQLDSQTKSLIAGWLGISDPKELDAYTEDMLDDVTKQIEQSVNEEFAEGTLRPAIDNALSTLSQNMEPAKLHQAIELVTDVNGELDIGELAAVVEQYDSGLAAALREYEGILAEYHVRVQANSDGNGNGDVYATASVSTNIKGKGSSGGYNRRSGGGGGGKSAADKLVEEQKRTVAEVEHRIKMNQTAQERADLDNDYDTQLSLIAEEVTLQKELQQVYRNNLSALEAARAKTKEGTDDWKKYTDAIYEAQEAIANLDNEITQLLGKELNVVLERQENNVKDAQHSVDMNSLFQERASLANNFNEQLALINAQLASQRELKDVYATNLAELIELRDAVDQGTQAWRERNDAVQDAEKAFHQAAIDYENILAQRINVITEQQTYEDQPTQHAQTMNAIEVSGFETLEQFDRERSARLAGLQLKRDQYDQNEKQIQQWTEEMIRLENEGKQGEKAWADARAAKWALIEENAQLEVDMIQELVDLQRKEQEEFKKAYDRSIAHDQYLISQYETYGQIALGNEDYEQYHEYNQLSVQEHLDLAQQAEDRATQALIEKQNMAADTPQSDLDAKDEEIRNYYLEASRHRQQAQQLGKDDWDVVFKQFSNALADATRETKHLIEAFSTVAEIYKDAGEWDEYRETLKAMNAESLEMMEANQVAIDVQEDIVAKAREEAEQTGNKAPLREAEATLNELKEQQLKYIQDMYRRAKQIQESYIQEIETAIKRLKVLPDTISQLMDLEATLAQRNQDWQNFRAATDEAITSSALSSDLDVAEAQRLMELLSGSEITDPSVRAETEAKLGNLAVALEKSILDRDQKEREIQKSYITEVTQERDKRSTEPNYMTSIIQPWLNRYSKNGNEQDYRRLLEQQIAQQKELNQINIDMRNKLISNMSNIDVGTPEYEAAQKELNAFNVAIQNGAAAVEEFIDSLNSSFLREILDEYGESIKNATMQSNIASGYSSLYFNAHEYGMGRDELQRMMASDEEFIAADNKEIEDLKNQLLNPELTKAQLREVRDQLYAAEERRESHKQSYYQHQVSYNDSFADEALYRTEENKSNAEYRVKYAQNEYNLAKTHGTEEEETAALERYKVELQAYQDVLLKNRDIMTEALKGMKQGTDGWDRLTKALQQNTLEMQQNASALSDIDLTSATRELDQFIETRNRDISALEDEISHYQQWASYYQSAGLYEQANNALAQENAARERLNALLAESIELAGQYLQTLIETGSIAIGSDPMWNYLAQITGWEKKQTSNTISMARNQNQVEDNSKAQRKSRKELYDYIHDEIKKRIQLERDMLDATVSIENTILDTIRERYRKEAELVEKNLEKQKEALAEEKELLAKRLQMRKDAIDKQDRYEELGILKAQLAAISTDTSRSKEAKELAKQIESLERENAMAIADAEVEVESARIDDQINAIDEKVELDREKLEAYLEDANNFKGVVENLLNGSFEDLTNWLAKNNTEYRNSLEEGRTQMTQTWSDTWDQMKNIVRTYWKEVQEIINGGYSSFTAFMMQGNDYLSESEPGKAAKMDEYHDKWYGEEKAYREGGAPAYSSISSQYSGMSEEDKRSIFERAKAMFPDLMDWDKLEATLIPLPTDESETVEIGEGRDEGFVSLLEDDFEIINEKISSFIDKMTEENGKLGPIFEKLQEKVVDENGEYTESSKENIKEFTDTATEYMKSQLDAVIAAQEVIKATENEEAQARIAQIREALETSIQTIVDASATVNADTAGSLATIISTLQDHYGDQALSFENLKELILQIEEGLSEDQIAELEKALNDYGISVGGMETDLEKTTNEMDKATKSIDEKIHDTLSEILNVLSGNSDKEVENDEKKNKSLIEQAQEINSTVNTGMGNIEKNVSWANDVITKAATDGASAVWNKVSEMASQTVGHVDNMWIQTDKAMYNIMKAIGVDENSGAAGAMKKAMEGAEEAIKTSANKLNPTLDDAAENMGKAAKTIADLQGELDGLRDYLGNKIITTIDDAIHDDWQMDPSNFIPEGKEFDYNGTVEVAYENPNQIKQTYDPNAEVPGSDPGTAGVGTGGTNNNKGTTSSGNGGDSGSGSGGETKHKVSVTIHTNIGNFTGTGIDTTTDGARAVALSYANAKLEAARDSRTVWSTGPDTVVTHYKHGGLVDFTGPAWVDGSFSEPEAFLSPVDTANIKALTNVLSHISLSPSMFTVPDFSNFGSTNNYGDINITINQAQLQTDADYEEVARKVGRAFTKQLSKKGINVGQYSF